jgi:hypothetical protein
MTQVYIIAGTMVLIVALISFVFMRQTISKRHKERMRLQRALDKRSKDLVSMLNAFPPQFLPRDLLIFLYRCIVDTFEQLSKLNPSDSEYIELFKSYTAQMESVIRTPQNDKEVSLQNSSQINEIRQYLNYLGRFLQRWMQRGNISQKQYGLYKGQLKRLITKLMVDNYILSAKQSIQIDKPKLAIHYYSLAKSLITKESLLTSTKGTLTMIQEELSSLEARVKLEEAEKQAEELLNEPSEGEEAESNQWQQFSEDDDWKKKNVYD